MRSVRACSETETQNEMNEDRRACENSDNSGLAAPDICQRFPELPGRRLMFQLWFPQLRSDGGARGGRQSDRLQHDEVVDGAQVTQRRDRQASLDELAGVGLVFVAEQVALAIDYELWPCDFFASRSISCKRV